MNNVQLHWLSRCLERRNWVLLLLLFCGLAVLSGCTSLGHEARAEPQLERQLSERPEVVSLEGSGELVIALELMLVSRGINVLPSAEQIVPETSSVKRVTRYTISATSVDFDVCIPEGSRQMNFYIAVTDLVENERLFVMNGNYGCKNTVVGRFERWFFE